MIRKLLVAAGAGALAAVAFSGTASAQFYKGKTLTLLINYPSGGPTDIEGRIIANHLADHIPGKPTVIVKNMGGAAGNLGANYLGEAAGKDGREVRVGGILTALRETRTRRGSLMAFGKLEDLEGSFDLVVFAEPFAQFGSLLRQALGEAGGEGPRPLLLMSPNWRGVIKPAIETGQTLAEKGYVVFVADMFGEGNGPVGTENPLEFLQPFVSDVAGMRRRIVAALDTLTKEADRRAVGDITRRAAIGFCFGGLNVLDLARTGADVQAVVSMHGTLTTPRPAGRGDIKAAVLAVHGAADPVAPKAERDAFEQEMTAAGAPRILVPVDGSENAARAVAHAIMLLKAGQAGTLHLLNVQRPVSGDVATFVGQGPIKAFHREEGMKALAGAIALCAQAAIPCIEHIGVGAPGPTIAAFAEELGCAQIVMGTRGLGAAGGLLMGSVANDVVRHAKMPVTLVK